MLTNDQYRELVGRLNRKAPGRLAAMWEAILLAHLSSLQSFKHEVPLSDGRKPDFQFCLAQSGIQRIFFRRAGVVIVGDITGVSDAGARKANDVDSFLAEFSSVVEKRNADMTQFDIKIGDTTTGTSRKRKVKLLLPRGSDRQKFFNEELKPYLRMRLSENDFGHKEIFCKGDYHIEVTFKQKSRFAGHSHSAFTSPKNTDQNPVWRRLKDKADQLRKAPKNAVKVVILCDCGCASMQRLDFSQNIDHLDIIKDYLRRESGIDVVIALTEVTKNKVMQQSWREHEGHLVASERWLRASTSNKTTAKILNEVLADLLGKLPDSVSNIESATISSDKFDYQINGTGGLQMNLDKITISARELHRLLANKITLEEFNDNYSHYVGHRFANELSKGSTISKVSLISRGENADDDRLEFTFQPDSALQPFE